MAEQPTEHLATWRPSTVGFARRHLGRAFRLDVDHAGQDRGRLFAGVLVNVAPSEVSSAYGALTYREEDTEGTATLSLPWGHPIEVLVPPTLDVRPLTPERAAELVEEAARRYDTDQVLAARARLAVQLVEHTEHAGADADDMVLLGAVLALVIADHPEVTG